MVKKPLYCTLIMTKKLNDDCKLSASGFQLDYSYLNLPTVFYSKIKPFKVKSPTMVIFNDQLADSLVPRFFVHTFGDAHIYLNHVDGVREQLKRKPGPLPRIEIANKPFYDITFDDIQLHDYQPQAFIKFPVAV